MPVSWGRHLPEQTRERICIVDDDVAVADSLKTLLETFGFDVQLYGSGRPIFSPDDRVSRAGCLVIERGRCLVVGGLDVVGRRQREGVCGCR